VVLTTNLVFSDWTRIFKDPLTTLAAIDHVVHHSVILDLMGVESYRAKAASTTQQTTGPPTLASTVHAPTICRRTPPGGVGRQPANLILI